MLLFITDLPTMEGVVRGPENCQLGFYERAQEAGLYRIDLSAPPKVFLLEDGPGCPQADKCRTKEHLAPGDEVMISHQSASGDYACVWYKPKGDPRSPGKIGWVPTRTLEPLPIQVSPDAEAWTGRWYGGLGQQLDLAAPGEGKVRVSGPGTTADDIAGAPPAALDILLPVNDYRAEAAWSLANPAKLRAVDKARNDDCVLRLQLQQDILVVKDNGRCGGGDFTGVYRKGG